MNQPIDQLTRGIIIGLKLINLSNSETLKILQNNNLKGSKQSVDRIWKEWQEKRESKPKFLGNQGRKQKLNEKSKQELINFVKNNPQTSKRDLQKFSMANPQGVSANTLVSAIQEQSLTQRKLLSIIKITPVNKEKRVPWVKNELRCQKKMIKNCIYSDETWVYFQNDYNQWVWVDQENENPVTIKIDKYPKKSQFGVRFTFLEHYFLKFIDGNLNNEKYLKLFQNSLKKSIQTQIILINQIEIKRSFKNQKSKFNWKIQIKK